MRNAIIVIIVLGILGWVSYDFISSNNTSSENEMGNKITAPPATNGDVSENAVVESEDIGLELGEIAPDFELETLDGETAKLSDFRGEKVLLNFWATWCPPCRAEMPDMQKFHEDTNVNILAVNLIETESSPQNVPEFKDELGLTFPILLDEGSELTTEYKIMAYPTSFMIDTNGRIQYKAFGAINYDIMIQEFEKMK
ncbi:peroxiredoxin [Gracilibacillus halotolerans]|uniref:Peroxiredoxin n=1 Tax=Gracilibacillus halotolerans TaxID=74386 RepID=A0A841RJ89_9BACI|nr:TlpA disulfide reductase family protein [Gracilibacillus halotolerans]MBB6512751.1 peroxiredoxin [Gracilibacillus halotolerans]